MTWIPHDIGPRAYIYAFILSEPETKPCYETFHTGYFFVAQQFEEADVELYSQSMHFWISEHEKRSGFFAMYAWQVYYGIPVEWA